jgi:hypothetical protein
MFENIVHKSQNLQKRIPFTVHILNTTVYRGTQRPVSFLSSAFDAGI